ncbi:MAG: CBS domain-containing protein [Actinomycetota bacterium]
MTVASDAILPLTDFDRPMAEPGDDLRAVARHLLATGRGAVLVQRRTGEVAVLTEHDIVRGVAEDGIEVWATDVMSREVVVVDATTSVTEAAQAMLDHGIRHLVVQDGDRLGILSLRDCVGPLVATADAT